MDYLFVVTYGRSGSTVLLNLLNAIEGYCIRGENGGVVLQMAEAARVVSEAKQTHGPHNKGVETPWYGIEDTDPAQWRRTLADGFSRDVLRPEPGCRVTGFKEIRYNWPFMEDDQYNTTIDFLATAFPNARIIFNTRDSGEVAKSGWWSHSRTPREVDQIIGHCNARFERSKDQLQERAFIIDYADYNGRPDGFAPLLEWLGEELAPEKLDQICAKKLKHWGDRKAKKPRKKDGVASRLRDLLRR